MNCTFEILEPGLATCKYCGFKMKTKQKDPTKVHRNNCDGKLVQEFIAAQETKIKQEVKQLNRLDAKKPNFLSRLANFSKAAISHIVKGSPSCTQEQIDARLAICKECPLYQISANNPDVGSCNACGCNINKENKFLNKLAWADQECPKGKWGRLDTPSEG